MRGKNMKSKMIKLMVIGLSATLVMGMVGCSSQDKQESTGNTITLYGGAGNEAYYKALANGFHKAYPDDTVNVKTEADNNYNMVLERTISGNNAPDIYTSVDLSKEVHNGLAANLDKYVKEYKWDQKLPSGVLEEGRVDKNGIIGSGSLYEAGGNAGSVVGVYYNKELAEKIGMAEIPQNIAQFEEDLQKSKNAGVTPIIGAGQDGTINHLLSLLLGDYTGAQSARDFVHHVNGATIDTPQALEAVNVLKSWIDKGYFNSDINSVGQQGSYGDFAAGGGLFMFQGSWMKDTMDKTFKGKYGFFPMPTKDANTSNTSMSGNMMFFSMAEKANNKDLSAKFLNWLTTKDADTIAQNFGFLTADSSQNAKIASIDSTLEEQLKAGYNVVYANDGFFSWHVNATTSMMTTVTQQLQLLFANKTTSKEVLNEMQTTYKNDLQSNK
jgi:raffinose/stachyose/melibiose transport system substrate-binding protein